MPFPRDRKPNIREQWDPAFPLPPLEVFSITGFERGVNDVRWTPPGELPGNRHFNVVGVNVYRSFNSEYGPYFRLNASPVGATFWRDASVIKLALNEDVSGSFIYRGDGPNGEYLFNTNNYPIVIYPVPGASNCVNLNVQVLVNGQLAYVDWIDPGSGTVRLRTKPTFDVSSQQTVPAVLPTGDDDVIQVTYRYVDDKVPTNLGQRTYYRVTTVARDNDTGALIETLLERASQTNTGEVEKLSYIWREAIRRNRWILEHGGERVKVMIHKSAGVPCGCTSSTHGSPSNDCGTCYGTGFVGGYEGPYDITIAPDDGDRAIRQESRGRTLAHQYETWTGPSPLLSQRDLIVKLNGDRYGLGPVRMPSNRGMQLQQHFVVSHLDETDIRYDVPVIDPLTMTFPQTRYEIAGHGDSTPMITERDNIPDEREFRGMTPTFENEHS